MWLFFYLETFLIKKITVMLCNKSKSTDIIPSDSL